MSVIVIDLICGIIFYLMYIKIKDKEKNEKDKISIKNIIYIICLVIIVSSVYDLITNLLITSTDVNTAKVYSMIVTSPIPLVILGTVIIGPIMEEIWFRGIILKRLLMRFSSKTSIIISALLFGVFHLALVQGIGAFFIGLVLGYLYYKTKSLYPCIIAHMINNFISVLANYFDYNEILSISYSNFIICLLFLIVGVFMFIFDKHKKSINV